ncbi:MAG: ABC transporter permease subunit [bacterium]|nr:ABC transporter permease subunit [bacterium]
MANVNDIKTVFSFFFKAGVRAKRTKLFFLFTLIPSIIFFILSLVNLTGPRYPFPLPTLFVQIGALFYFQLFIQFLALFYGSTVLSDEVDNKTMVYLTTSPVSKASIMAGKFSAHFLIISIIVVSGLTLSYIICNFSNLLNGPYLVKFGMYIGVGLLSLVSYSALFTLMGTVLRRAVIAGLFYLFVWEFFVQYIPGTTQKLTINHYVKSLLPQSFTGEASLLTFQLEASSTFESISTLLVLAILFLSLSTFIFYKKQYPLSDQA